MNRTKLITLSVIVLMLALIAGKRLFTGSELEQPAAWEVDADTLVLQSAAGTTTLVKKGEEWFIKDSGWKAESRFVQAMVRKLGDMTLYDRISESGQYSRYDLDEEGAVHVTVLSAGETLRDIFIGKQSPGVNQSYVRFPDDKSVYLAGDFGTHDFSKSVSELRDKAIAEIPESAIETLSVSFDDTSYTLVKKEETRKDDEGNETKETLWLVKDAENTALDQNKAKALIGQLRMMQAAGFTTQSALKDGDSPYLSLSVEAFDTKVSIDMYELGEDELVVTTSQRPDFFTMQKSNADSMRKTIDDLLISE